MQTYEDVAKDGDQEHKASVKIFLMEVGVVAICRGRGGWDEKVFLNQADQIGNRADYGDVVADAICLD